MATDLSSEPSFSRSHKWSIGLNVIVAIVAVFAVMVMLNYLSARYFERLYLSSLARVELSPRTIGLLRSITNPVDITIYYDQDDRFYRYIADLLREYHL